MPTNDLETTVTGFLVLGRRLQEAPTLTGERVLEQFTAWYGEIRVIDADLAEGGDMLLLQWGTTRMLDLSAPIDLRDRDDLKVRFADTPERYLNFTRQVFAPTESETEFDDEAVQMSLTLCYGPPMGEEPNSNMWISIPDEVAEGICAFSADKYVQTLLPMVLTRLIVTAECC